VRDLEQDANDRAIIVAIIHIAKALGMDTLAEGWKAKRSWIFCRHRAAILCKATCSAARCPHHNLKPCSSLHAGVLKAPGKVDLRIFCAQSS
jgi:hypothetical protein